MKKSTLEDKQKLAIDGGTPVRSAPLPLEFPGVHHMDEREVEAVAGVLRARSPFRFYGVDLQNEVASFEDEFAKFVGVPYALAVSSGTGALHTALAALGIGPGQEVIVPAYLWVSVIAAVVNLGAIPVLADIDDTFCLNTESVRQAITPRTRGIVMVHMSGAPGNVTAIASLARAHELFLLEDCAQCAGGSIDGRSVGTFGDMGIFSFQMNKNMTSGEGGCIVTRDLHLLQRCVACHDLGYPRQNGRLVFDDPDVCLWGRGYRLDELRAAVLRVQLAKLPTIVGAMRRSKYRIRQTIEPFHSVRLRTIADPAGDTGCFLIMTFPNAAKAREVQAALQSEGLVTHPQGLNNLLMTDWGLHLYYNNRSLLTRRGFPWTLAENAGLARNYTKGTCPVADQLFEQSILLAIPSCLTREDEDSIICAIEKTFGALC